RDHDPHHGDPHSAGQSSDHSRPAGLRTIRSGSSRTLQVSPRSPIPSWPRSSSKTAWPGARRAEATFEDLDGGQGAEFCCPPTYLDICCPSTWRFRVRQPRLLCPPTWILSCPLTRVGTFRSWSRRN